MKTFAQYLTESQKTHSYRIKIVGDLPAEFSRQFREQLRKFDPVSVGETKTTPVMSQPQDFPAWPNNRVNIIDVELRYPATPPQIQQMARLLGLTDDRICSQQRDYSETMDLELAGIQQQKDVLTTPYPADTPQQRELKQDYAAVGADKAVVRNSADGAKWTVAGGPTRAAETTDSLPQGVKSPMTKVSRPPLPQRGFRTQGK